MSTKPSSVNKYLLSGKQTGITPRIEEAAKGFRGSLSEQISGILAFVKTFPNKGFDSATFRKRTADDILRDGYITGCSDSALLFIALARALHLPTKYIEALDKEWLKNGGSTIHGHVYAEIYDVSQKRWVLIDPMGSFDIPKPEKGVFLSEGLDSWDIGIHNFESMRIKAAEFRRKWLTKLQHKKLTT